MPGVYGIGARVEVTVQYTPASVKLYGNIQINYTT